MSSLRSFRRLRAVVAVAILAPLALTGCAVNEAPGYGQSEGSFDETDLQLSGIYNGAGASAQDAAQSAWITGFQSAHPRVTINYNPIGSGGGRSQFIEGAVTYAGSDSYLNDQELEGSFSRCAADTKAIDLPVFISPIAIAFNVEGVEELNLDAQTMARIFKGEITTWDDPAIATLNEGTDFPSTAITVVHRSDDSGTTDNFTDYLHATAPQVWEAEPSDSWPYTFAGAEGAQGTSGVVQAISGGRGTIGYAEASRVGDLPTVAVKVGEDFVKYSPEGTAKVVDSSPRVDGRAEHDFAVQLDRTTTESGVYPVVLISYLIVCEQYKNPADAEFIKAYATYIASPEGQGAAAAGAGSAPISEDTRIAIQAAIDSIK